MVAKKQSSNAAAVAAAYEDGEEDVLLATRCPLETQKEVSIHRPPSARTRPKTRQGKNKRRQEVHDKEESAELMIEE